MEGGLARAAVLATDRDARDPLVVGAARDAADVGTGHGVDRVLRPVRL